MAKVDHHLGLEPLDFGKCAKFTIFQKNSELKFFPCLLPGGDMDAIDALFFQASHDPISK